MNKINTDKTGKISKYALSLVAAITLGANSPSFGMNILEAIQHGEADTVRRLIIENGLRLINSTDIELYNTRTPLYYTCEYNRPEIARLLLENGANPNVVDLYDSTPLSEACFRNNLEIVEIMLEYGANIDESSTDQVQINKKNPDKALMAHKIEAVLDAAKIRKDRPTTVFSAKDAPKTTPVKEGKTIGTLEKIIGKLPTYERHAPGTSFRMRK